MGIAVDANGNVYVCDSVNHVVRKLTPDATGLVYTTTVLAGTPSQAGKGTDNLLNTPSGVAVDASGNVYIADTGNQIIRMVPANGSMVTIAGNPATMGSLGDSDISTNALFNAPSQLSVDAYNNLYIVDRGNNKIRKLTLKSNFAQ